MRNKHAIVSIATVSLLAGYGIAVWRESNQPNQRVRVTVSHDAIDTPIDGDSSGKIGFDQFFTHRNSIPGSVK